MKRQVLILDENCDVSLCSHTPYYKDSEISLLSFPQSLFLAEDNLHEIVIALAVGPDHHVDLMRDDSVVETVEVLEDPQHPDILTTTDYYHTDLS